MLLNVIFPSLSARGVGILAKHHLQEIAPTPEMSRVRQFLRDLSERTDDGPGDASGVSNWGGIFTGTDGEHFVMALKPFWKELLVANEVGDQAFGPCIHEHILVFSEQEAAEKAYAFEISIEGHGELAEDNLKIEKHLCPFSWKMY